MKHFIRSFLAFLFPERCAACDGAVSDAVMCAPCAVSLVPSSGGSCPRCALVYLEPDPHVPNHLCGACVSGKRRAYGQARAAFAYGGALRDAVSRWKNAPDQSMGPGLARLMLAGLAEHAVDDWPASTVVVVVPSHRRRIRRRGFNPAGVLGRALARQHRLRFAPAALAVTRLTSSKRLGRQARRERVRGLYRVRRPRQVRGRHVVLVDDVITTGATAQAVARQLRFAGAASVEVVVLAGYAV